MRTLFLCVVLLSPTALAQTFVDRTAESGLSIGGGPLAFCDLNTDRITDLYANGAAWLGRGDGTFARCDAPGNGVVADIDNDGVGDLISFSPIAVYRGVLTETGMRFEAVEVPTLPPLEGTVCRGVAVGDFDGDGVVDAYFGGFENWEKQITYPSFLLWHKKGGGFALEIITQDYRTRGVTACDYDEDGDIDVYASNYRLQPNLLWINDGRGHFTNDAAARNAAATSAGFAGGHSIGACWGDFDADGRVDLFAGNFAHVDSRGDQPKSRFLRNLGGEKSWAFDDRGECGVWYQESYASPVCADFDNDGALDLFFTTVYADASFGKKNYPVLYRNDSTKDQWLFKDVTAGSGLEQLAPTYQAACADVNGDGRVDLISAGRLFINTTKNDTHWLAVRVTGDGAKISRGAVGAQVRIALPDGRTLTRQVEIGTGEGNSNSPTMHFGLGGFAGPATIIVRWPDGRTRTITDVACDQMLDVAYEPGAAK